MATIDEERARRIEGLVRRVEGIDDRESRESALQLMQAVLELHGAGLERIIEIVLDAGEPGEAAMRRFSTDALVSNLLILHGLHPDCEETRIEEALRKTHGRAELIGLFEGVARVRLSEAGCGLRETVENLVREAAPEVREVVIEEAAVTNGFVPLSALAAAVPEVV
jgi:hypothetical protein